MIRVMAVTNENQIFDREPVVQHGGDYPSDNLSLGEPYPGDFHTDGFGQVDAPMFYPMQNPYMYRDQGHYYSYPYSESYPYSDYFPDYSGYSPYRMHPAPYPYPMYYPPYYPFY